MTATGHDLASAMPQAPRTVEETGIPEPFLRELLVKTMWVHDHSSMGDLAALMGLRVGVIDELAAGLRREHLCEVEAGVAIQTDRAMRLRLTESGKALALDALQRSRYVGVAPVPLGAFTAMVQSQKSRFRRPTLDQIRSALSHLSIADRIVRLLGQAFFSRLTLMIYGPSGNGKSNIITSLARVVDGGVVLPYTVYVQGQLIRVFDPDSHAPIDLPNGTEPALEGIQVGDGARYDRRWVAVSRPAVLAGGDMGAEALEMTYDATLGVYSAPLSVIAQGGVLLIDDLGRQRISHEEILNRWVIMMEQGYDSFALTSGELIRLPLDVTLVFTTNLSLTDLMDEAFLRRIAYKIQVPSPNPDQLADIARRFCQASQITWTEEAIHYMMDRLFAPGMPEPRGCYPRDLISIVLDEADFLGHPAVLTDEAIDTALAVYLGGDGASRPLAA